MGTLGYLTDVTEIGRIHVKWIIHGQQETANIAGKRSIDSQ
jgi:hypothetical protein